VRQSQHCLGVQRREYPCVAARVVVGRYWLEHLSVSRGRGMRKTPPLVWDGRGGA
jgi:hypothetical protein